MYPPVHTGTFELLKQSKMKKITTQKLKSSLMAGSILAALVLSVSSVSAQKFKRHSKSYHPSSNRYFLGVVGGVGTSTFKFDSDIEDLSGLKALAEGWNAGLIFGDNQFKLRASFGEYAYQKSLSESVEQKVISTKITVSPSGLFGNAKFIRVYLLTGVDYSTFSFQGMTIPKYVDPNLTAGGSGGSGSGSKKNKCCCETSTTSGPPNDPGLPSDPDLVAANMSSDLAESDPDVAKTVPSNEVTMKKAQIDTGLGAEFVGVKNGRFFRMFVEAHYGIPFKEIISDLSVNNTSISSQLVMNFGISIGITRGY
jgi:hypothetical protein